MCAAAAGLSRAYLRQISCASAVSGVFGLGVLVRSHSLQTEAGPPDSRNQGVGVWSAGKDRMVAGAAQLDRRARHCRCTDRAVALLSGGNRRREDFIRFRSPPPSFPMPVSSTPTGHLRPPSSAIRQRRRTQIRDRRPAKPLSAFRVANTLLSSAVGGPGENFNRWRDPRLTLRGQGHSGGSVACEANIWNAPSRWSLTQANPPSGPEMIRA